MTTLLCLLFPAVLSLYARHKILTGDIHRNKRYVRWFCEYGAAVLLLNIAVIAILYIAFGYTGSWRDLLQQHTVYRIRYLVLAVFLAIAELIAENYFRFHASIRIAAPKISTGVLYLYAAALGALNFVRVFDNTFWGDEGFTIGLAKMSVGEMVRTTAGDVHPPLYYLFVQLLYRILGDMGVVYHLSAFIPYAVILVLACTAVKKRFGWIPAAVLVTMSSIMKEAVVHNVEARMYALAALFVLIAYLALYDILKEDTASAWVLFCAASLGAAYTHYYALISVAFFYVMLIPAMLKNKRKMRRLAVSYAVTILAYLPWLTVLVHSFTKTKDDWWLGYIPSVKECVDFVLDYTWLAVVFAAVLIVFVWQQKRFTNDVLWVLAGVLSACGTAAVGLALSYIVRPFFIARYLFPVTAVVYLLFGFCISKIQPHKLLTAGIIVMILLANLPAYAEVYTLDKWKDEETSRFCNTVKPTADAVIYTNDQHLCWNLVPYYYPGIADEYAEDVRDALDGRSEIWLYWRDDALDEDTLQMIQENGYTAECVYDGYFANSTYHAYKLEKQG